MLATPSVPQFSGVPIPNIAGAMMSFPIRVEMSPLILVVLTMLVGIFVAAISVILVYHWRRFPFEPRIFRAAERIYFMGVLLGCVFAVVGILIS